MLTILSTILGMIPFLIDGPDEQPFWFSLAVGTIGGLLLSVIPLVLFLPAVLRMEGKDYVIPTGRLASGRCATARR